MAGLDRSMLLPATMLIFLVASLLPTGTPAGGEIAKRFQSPPAFVATTSKPIVDLELCLADAVSSAGTPGAFHDGPKRSVITATGAGRIYVALDLVEGGGTTRVTGQVHPGYAKRIESQVLTCL